MGKMDGWCIGNLRMMKRVGSQRLNRQETVNSKREIIKNPPSADISKSLGGMDSLFWPSDFERTTIYKARCVSAQSTSTPETKEADTNRCLNWPEWNEVDPQPHQP